MLTVFWNSESAVLADFIEKTTINSQRYIETLAALKRRIERIGIRNEKLHHDNVRPHTGSATRYAIQRLDFQCYRIHHIAQIWLQVIASCLQN
jgi:hypothetical protein